MSEPEYVIRELENDGKVRYISGIAGPPPISSGPGTPDFHQYLAPRAGLALTFADKESAEETAAAFRAANPDRNLEVVPKPES